MMSSPLATMATVIKEKSTAAMPFVMSLVRPPPIRRPSSLQATFLSASSWGAYGLLVAQDPYIYAPNILGVLAATVQLGLFAKYGIHKSK